MLNPTWPPLSRREQRRIREQVIRMLYKYLVAQKEAK
jgi:hypothetical protein